MSNRLSESEAWQPLPETEWDDGAARHLLRRAGWTAKPETVARALNEGLAATLKRLFPDEPLTLAKPSSLVKLEAETPAMLDKSKTATGEAKLAAQKELRERRRAALHDLRMAWLQQAAQEDAAARAKWQLCLSDVWVVSAEKVENSLFIWQHFDVLARHGFGPAPALAKAVSRSPAMIEYLDLNANRRQAPNENFARELFELFVLGEGHYTERDIKEAARAFTGYHAERLTGAFRFAPKQHDGGPKTIFGQTRKFDGDGVIDLAYAQPAAACFLPGELAKFYLTDKPLPREQLAAIGERWRAEQLDLAKLARLFFGSRLFYAPEYRGNFIKSPVQLYLGMVQDLGLTVPPLARYTIAPLRRMGQELFQPPNVRGWVGGRAWINSATLAARRQLTRLWFDPLREDLLNADEQRALAEVRDKDPGAAFTIKPAWTELHLGRPPESLARDLIDELDLAGVGVATQAALRTHLAAHHDGAAVRDAAIALLETPDYQLC